MNVPFTSFPGSDSTMVLAEEGLFVWGNNNSFQLGLGDNHNRSTPEKHSSLSQLDLRSISCSQYHALATTINGELLVWGKKPGDTTERKTPEKVTSMSNENVVQVSAGGYFSLALTSKGKIFSEGNNDKCQLGQGDNQQRTTFTEITSIPTNITFISSGYQHTLALDENGDVWSWGSNSGGELGLGHNNNQPTPTKVILPSPITQISAGGEFSAALSKEGVLFLWGHSSEGQIGLGSTDHKNTPQQLPLSETVVYFSCGSNHVLALTENGKLLSWGYNDYGQLGHGDTTGRLSPTEISFDFGAEIATIACGAYHSLVFTKSGNIFIWGSSENCELGFEDPIDQDVPNLLKTSFTPKIFDFNPFCPQFMKTQNFSLHHLLKSEIYSDLEIFGKKVHRCIVHSRCPKFLEVDLSPFPKSVIFPVIDFFYSDSTEYFSGLPPEDICDLVHFSHSLGLPGLVSLSQTLLMDSLTSENAFHVLLRSVTLGLSEETEWIIWFIGKNKVLIPKDVHTKLFTLSQDISFQAFNESTCLTLPPPKIVAGPPLPSLVEDLERLLLSGELADFHLSIRDTVLPLHKCLLSSWDYSKILFHDEKHSLQMPLETFKKILLFFYSGNVTSLSFRDTIYISSLGSFYLLDDTNLFRFCGSSLSSGINNSNWMEAFVLGIQMGDEELQKKAEARAPASSPSVETMKMLQVLCGENQVLKAKTEIVSQENEELKATTEIIRQENEELKASTSREISELKARLKALEQGDGPTKP
jgi:alpha-tubulin suppressor-like RCC1 family protein